MIISHRHKFIFIKTVKTAGTSIEVFLSRACGDFDVVTPVWPAEPQHQPRNYRGRWNPMRELFQNANPHGPLGTAKDLFRGNRFYNHMPALLTKCRIDPDTWDSYTKFCVERNPWDKTLSHYHMISDRLGGEYTLDDYMQKGHYCLNHPKYLDHKGNLLVDKVIRFESLMDDLGALFEQLGIPFDGSLGVKAKSSHRKDSRPYQEVFSDEHAQQVARVFSKEIKLHGYQF